MMKRSACTLALVVGTCLTASTPAFPACDGQAHVRWVTGFNYERYEPGEGTVGYAYDVERIGSAVMVSIPDNRQLLSYRIDIDGTLTASDNLGNVSVGNIVEVGGYAYVSMGNHLEIIELSSLGTMTTVGTVPGPAGYLALRGSLLYVSGGAGIHVIDVSDPLQPQVVGTASGVTGRLAASDDWLYIVDWQGVWAVDVSDPANPSYEGNVLAGGFVDVAADDDHLYVLRNGNWALEVHELADPLNPTEIAVLPMYAASRVERYGSTLVIGASESIRWVDVTDPANPAEFASHAGLDFESVDMEDGYLYVADGNFHVLELRDLVDAQPMCSHPDWDRASDVTPYQDFLVLVRDSAVRILDASDPSAPVEVGSLPYGSTPTQLCRDGNYAYYRADSALRIADLSDPTQPVEVGSLPDANIQWLAVGSGRAYMSAGDMLQIADVSDPSNPFLIYDNWLDWFDSIAVIGNTLFGANNFEYNAIVYAVDFTDVDTPVYDQIWLGSGYVTALAVHDDVLYISGSEGVSAADPSTLDTTALTGARLFGTREFVAGDSGDLLTLGGGGSVQVLSTGPDPGHVFGARTPDRYAYGIAELNGHLWVSDREGLHVYEKSCAPTDVAIPTAQFRENVLRVYPNPTPGQVRLVWASPGEPDRMAFAEEPYVTVEIFAPTGRRLWSDRVDARVGEFVWDGFTESGDRVPAGVVFARVRAGDKVLRNVVRIVR